MENKQQEKHLDPQTLPIPEILSILPVHGFVFFPGMGFPLQVSSESAKQLIDDALLKERVIGLVTHRKEPVAGEEKVLEDDLYHTGVVGYIHKLTKLEKGYYQVMVSGVKKMKIREFVQSDPYITAKVDEIPLEMVEDQKIDALILNIRNQFQKLVQLISLPEEMSLTVNSMANHFYSAYMVISQLNLKVEEEQELFEIRLLDELLHRTARELNKRVETAAMSQQLQESFKKDMDDNQRKFYLRQQLKAIQKELGEGEDDKVEINELRKRVDETVLSEEARMVVDKELNRLERIQPSSPEYTVSRNYVD